jgi:hypothetical protein
MKKALTLSMVAALTAGAIVAPQGGAATGKLVRHRFTAPLQGGVNNAGVEMNIFFKGRTPKYMTDLQWANVSCGGPFAGVQHWRARVAKKKFTKKHAIDKGVAGSTVKITGKLVRRHGKWSLSGTFAVSATTGCPRGTGTLPYKTRR